MIGEMIQVYQGCMVYGVLDRWPCFQMTIRFAEREGYLTFVGAFVALCALLGVIAVMGMRELARR